MADENFKGVLGYFLLNWRITFLLMIGLALAGLITLVTLPRESTPEVKIPFASVVTVYPGASARDVEELVTDKVEDRVTNIAGVKEVSSSSRLGISVVSIEFNAEEDLEVAIRRLREAVARVNDLPVQAEDPEVIEISFESDPIITIALGGINDARLLTVLADDVADDIKGIAGVSDVQVVGARTEEIHIEVDPVKLAELNVSVGQIMGALQASNANIPLGQVTLDDFGYDVRVQGRFSDVSDVAAVAIRTANGDTITLDHLARVQLALTDTPSESRIHVAGKVSTAAVTIQVAKKTGGNIIDIVDKVEEELATIQETKLPPEVVIETFADRADEIRQALSDLTDSGLQTLIIVFIVMWLFMGWKIALIASLGVPLTFAMSFLVFEATGITLNGISLFSLIIALGLLVDNAIVLIEGIQRGVGKPHLRAHAMTMVRQFQKPLIGGTLTTVAAFVPLLLVSGIIGEFLRTIPIVLTATLLSSLFVALAFLPAVTVRMMQKDSVAVRPRKFDVQYGRFQEWYSQSIDYMLRNRRAQNIFIGSLVVLLIIGFALPFTGLLKTGLFPEANVDFIIVNIELPSGTQLAKTSAKVKEIEGLIADVPEIKSYVTNIGTSSSFDIGGNSSSENVASLFINLTEDRQKTSAALANELQPRLTAVQGANVSILELSGGPPTSSPVELRVSGQDLNQLAEISATIMQELAGIPGAIEVNRNLRFSAGEFALSFDPHIIAQYGLSPSEVSLALRTYLFGTEVTSFLADGEERAVRISATPESVQSISDIQALPVTSATGHVVRIGQIAQVELNTSVDAIRRLDGERTVTINADTDGTRTANEISAELQEKIGQMSLPDGYHVDFGGEQQETEETFADLYRSMIIGIVLIMIIMVLEFNSYVQPFLIFLSIPFALIGVLFGLMLFGGQLNFAAFLGLVSLTGIVVNNGIVLVDRINQGREEGLSVFEAIKDAGNTRLRPVVLSNLTSIFGVVPLLFVDDQFYRDLSLTLITGQLFSTVLTLVFIPVLSLRFEERKQRRAARRAARGQKLIAHP